ncbi:hypothetical protein ACI2IY_20845 [Lysobacter enzymogenes]|uniref:hypothetical protein n=1 Tax=Lysobacter enzymogenes TaxID=69 RepID=UPI0038514FAA
MNRRRGVYAAAAIRRARHGVWPLAAPVPAPPAQIEGDRVEAMVPVAFFINCR